MFDPRVRLCRSFVQLGVTYAVLFGGCSQETVPSGSGEEGSGVNLTAAEVTTTGTEDGHNDELGGEFGTGTSSGTGTTSTSETGECLEDGCEPTVVCGDGVLATGEACDDGNRMPGDGCNGVCAVEANHVCPEPGAPCVSTIVCGDGQIAGTEACDDGNDVAQDGCSSRCSVESGYNCPAAGMPCVPSSSSECGNSAVEYPETCDDGNMAADDGCSATCTREPGYSCPEPGAPCIEDEFCGDGQLADGEQCDDLNLTPGDGCDGRCRMEAYFECPVAGERCVSRIVCGDLDVIADEACDDGRQCTDGTDCTQGAAACTGIGDGSCAPRGGDGCAADCRSTEPGFRCPTTGNVGGPCTAIPDPACGDGRRDFGEYCDDGNLNPSDGCTERCAVTPGYTCPSEGALCQRIAWCGDGARGNGEQCDDGSACEDETTACLEAEDCEGIGGGTCAPRGGDGCTSTCAIEADHTCPPAGGACTSLVYCGDARTGGQETCDLGGVCEDGTTPCADDPSVCAGIGGGACRHADAPGCLACALQTGWRCSRGGVCRAAECGDGLATGLEFCDDGKHCEDGSSCAADADCAVGACAARSGDGCDDACTLEPGFSCETPGAACTPTTCGDGIAEGLEQCDDGNNDTGDGCTPFCVAEPLCDEGPCTSQCGDAIMFAGEGCDDGNLRDGDGCSSTCVQEVGFMCEVATGLPAQIQIPIVVRDYHGSDSSNPVTEHPDFELASGEPTGATTGIVRANAPACFEDLGDVGDPSDDRVRGGDLGCADETYDMEDNAGSVLATISMAGKPVFFDTDCHLSADPATSNGWTQCIRTVADADSFHQWYTDRPAGVNAPAWNANPTAVLPLTLVNGRFSNGGVYTAGGTAFSFDSRSMSIEDPNPAGTEDGFYPIDDLAITGTSCGASSANHNFHMTSEVRYWFEYDSAVTPALSFSGDDDVWVYVNGYLALDLGGIHGRSAATITLNSANAALWGLRDGNIYEIAVFQAERNQCASNYWLTLDGFVPRTSVCESDCGDGVTASTEDCDDGTAENDGRYEGCNVDCTLGPYCGDGEVSQADGEICDAGAGFVVYGGTEPQCGPECQYAPYCGDANVDGSFGEACDDGVNDGSYGTCNADCSLAPYCGDGAASGDEECDDGVANGTTGSSCRADCRIKCGDGALDPGESCDEGDENENTYGSCRTDCRLGPYCGDGIPQVGYEACDDGLNDGTHGTCAPGCVLGPRCGDGIVQGPAGERCDLGAANVASGYGIVAGCTTRCWPTPYCGDGAVTDAETCDDGVNSGSPGSCTPGCDGFIPLSSCGDGDVDPGEQCDHGSANGTDGDACDPNCRNACGNGIQDVGETCDDGVNDGSYGGCEADCTPAGYCGDGVENGPETCDRGDENEADPYGPGRCTMNCEDGPMCGDGRTQARFGEECDGQAQCNGQCRVYIP